jgi:DNA polymerase-3 subunit epsilon
MLPLKRPLVIFDIEATGMNLAADKIVEICILKVKTDGSEETRTWRINPERKIPAEVTAIHGITNEDVKDEPTFAQLAPEIMQFIAGCDMVGYNSNYFDVPMLNEEFLRVGMDLRADKRRFIDVFKIFQKMERRDLKAAYMFYCGKEHNNAHSAEADVIATYEVLKGQLERYADTLPADVESLHEFTTEKDVVDAGRRLMRDENGTIRFNFGKYRGLSVEEVLRREPQYYDWIMKGDFLLDTKQKLQEIWLGSKFKIK